MFRKWNNIMSLKQWVKNTQLQEKVGVHQIVLALLPHELQNIINVMSKYTKETSYDYV